MLEWAGQEMVGRDIALMPAGPVTDEMLGCTGIVAASERRDITFIPLERIRDYLAAHEDHRFLTFDVAALHWRLFDTQGDSRHGPARDAVWQLSRDCRLIDIELFDQRCRLVRHGVFPHPSTLQELADRYLDNDASSRSPRPLLPDNDSDQVLLVLEIGQRLLAAVEDCFPDISPQKRRFGLLATGLDAQAAIACACPALGEISVDMSAANRLYQDADREFRDGSLLLHRDRAARHQFHWTQDRVAVDSYGEMLVDREGIRLWLERELDRIRGDHRARFAPPLADDGQLALDPELWGDLVLYRPVLCAWRRVARAAQTMAWLRSLPDCGPLAPRYSFVSRLASRWPDLTAIRAAGGGIFKPRDGHSFLILTLQDLDLRCWAAVAQNRRPGGVYIAQMFFDDEDPVLRTAHELHKAERGLELLPSEMDRLRDIDGGYWVQLASTLLKGLAHGLTEAQLGQRLRETFPQRDFGNAEAAQRRSRLVRRLYAELGELSDEDLITEVLSAKLGITEEELIRAFPAKDHDKLPNILRRALDDDSAVDNGCIRQLQSVCRNPRLAETLGQPGTRYQALAELPTTPNGGLGRYEYGATKYIAASLMLADEVRKAVAYDLVAAGHNLVALAADDFVLEIQSHTSDALSDILAVANAAATRIVGAFATGCCRQGVADRW